MGKLTKATRLAATILILLASLAPVLAAPANPSSMDILSVSVYRNLISTGDQLYIFRYSIAYGTLPSETADELFNFRLLDTDGATLLGSALPYPYNDSGYGQGASGFYFTTADAPAWGGAYFIQISPNPVSFPSLAPVGIVLSSSDYYSSSNAAENRAALASYVLTQANYLQIAWSTTMITAYDVGNCLSTTGETYFRFAIPGISTMAPLAFYTKLVQPSFSPTTWTNAQATTYENRYSANWVGESITDFSNMLGVPGTTISGTLFVLVPVIFMAVWCKKKFGSITPALVAGSVVASGGAVMGFLPFALRTIMAIMAAMFVGYIFFFRHA